MWWKIVQIGLLLGLVAGGRVGAQSPADTVQSISGIEIKTSVDKAEVLIGDLITYKVTITHDSAISLVPPPLGANLGAFDVKDYQADVETKLKDGRVQNQTTFVLSTFTTGDYIIPPVPVLFEMPDKSRKVMMAEAVPIKVKSLLTATTDSADIRPIKDPYLFKRNLVPYYVAGGILLAAIIGFLFWLKLRKKPEPAEIVDTRPAWEIASEKLALLRASTLLDQEKYKEYYIELTEIVRAYLGRVYGIAVLDMTTEEFLEEFRPMELPLDLYEQTASLLRHADLVKFAKYVPARQQAETDFETAHQIVEIVRADQERLQQTEVRISGEQPRPTGTTGGNS